MARNSDEWEKEREEMMTRLELTEARTKKNEELLMAMAAKLGIGQEDASSGHERETVGGSSGAEHIDSGKWRKLEIPVFAGEDAYGWTHRLERYFVVKGVTDEEKMKAIMVALEGRALSWFQWWERCNPNPNWEGFKYAVIRRFQPSMIQNPFELLLSLRQTGTVEEFVEEFEKYVGALREIDQEFVKGIFMNGLKEEMQVELRLYELNTLLEVIQKSLMIEQKNVVLNKKNNSQNFIAYGNYRNGPYNRTVMLESKNMIEKKGEPVSLGVTIPQINSEQSREGPRSRGGEFKHLTGAEMREKRENWLCFRCDEPYSWEHRCKNKQLRMIILEEDEEEEGLDENQTVMGNFSALQLSLYSMTGFTTTKSWKVGGQIGDKSIVIPIDCGASHNFIARELVEQLELRVEDTPSYIVEVGDGHKIKCKGKCT